MSQAIAIAIPTFKRPTLLKALVDDLTKQTVQPQRVIIVDADPASGEVKAVLQDCQIPSAWTVVYVPSWRYANAAFQRYVGWRMVGQSEVLIYLDDDLRISQVDAIEQLIAPLVRADTNAVGTTPIIHFPDAPSPKVQKKQRRYVTGDITPVGHRLMPVPSNRNFDQVHWLHGGVMAYKVAAIASDAYLDDMFAMCHIGCGLGVDDTALSRRIGLAGSLYRVNTAHFEHPNADISRAYPHAGYKKAYAIAYSRRFLNDHYRIDQPATWGDRVALLKNYAGNMALAWSQVLIRPNSVNLAWARGMTLGVLHGLTRPPTAKRLTPEIDWWSAADETISLAEELQLQPLNSPPLSVQHEIL